MDKRVRLQGWGAGSVTINAAKSKRTGAGRLARTHQLEGHGAQIPPTFDLLPGQTLGIDPANNEPLLFGAEEGPGILVVGRQGAHQRQPARCVLGGNARHAAARSTA